jgi:hypothetical protein
MGTFTAQLLIGRAHPYEGGIYGLTHTLYLSENGRPAWILQSLKEIKEPITWIPTVDHMLEDALLMIGLYVFTDEELRKMQERYFTNKNKSYAELYEDVDSRQLEAMRERCRELTSEHKIMISVFEGSSIHSQLPIIKNYDIDFEVCQSVFQKAYNVWNKKREERGAIIP